jgi:hypothetical protein
MLTLNPWCAFAVAAFLFVLGYCLARCGEEDRRCRLWLDGVNHGVAMSNEYRDIAAPVKPDPSPEFDDAGLELKELPY